MKLLHLTSFQPPQNQRLFGLANIHHWGGCKQSVTAKCKKQHSRQLATKRQKIKTANAQNSTFANRTGRHTTKICKKAVFLLTHPSPPTTP
jgi:hypothetical protein